MLRADLTMDSRREYKAQWAREHRESVRRSNRKQYLKNKEKRLSYGRKWYQEHKAHCNARSREWHKRTYPQRRAEVLKQTAEYAKAHPEIRRKCHLNYVRNHPEKHKAQQRAAAIAGKARRRRANVGDLKANRIIRAWKLESSFICYYCKKQFPIDKLTVDHVQAVARNGKHTTDNLSKACPQCNIRKRHHPISQIKFLDQPLLDL